MTDPYTSLGEVLVRAAGRQEGHRDGPGRLRAWLSRHVRGALAATLLVLSGGAVALAATGLLSGAPVAPETRPNPSAGNGVPVRGANLGVAITAADPAGGLKWGARVFHTTRGEACIEVARVRAGQLGELGEDSVLGDDGRFHALPASELPPGYGGASGDVECVASGQTVIFEDAHADRSGARLVPEEFVVPHVGHRRVPPTGHQRALAYGLLGPHAVSVTYRTPAGLRTVPVQGPDGAFLIVQRAGYFKDISLVGGSIVGRAEPGSVTVPPPVHFRPGMLTAATFRFGSQLCSQGSGSLSHPRCPERLENVPQHPYNPTRSLHRAVKLTLLRQSPQACRRAFLRLPCYKGEVAFTAPYAITAAGTDYLITGAARCAVGGRPETGWSLERDVRRAERVRTVSLGLFVYTPRCAAHESFTVVYANPGGASPAAPHESVIVGKVSFNEALLPNSR
jgi:hypothetical protein